MARLPIMKASIFSPSVRFYERLGTPVERELRKVGLPTCVTDLPDSFFSARLVMMFRNSCKAIEKIDDAGWAIANSNANRTPSAKYARLFRSALNVYGCLRILADHARRDTNFVDCLLRFKSGEVEVHFYPPPPFEGDAEPALWQWNSIMVATSLVQMGAGADWRPTRIGFSTSFKPCNEALAYFANTRFHFNQPRPYVAFPHHVLALPVAPGLPPVAPLGSRSREEAAADPAAPQAGDLVGSLKAVLKSYIAEEKAPDIFLGADMAGTSRRTLQRRLKANGLRFTEVLDQCRFELASELLVDPGMRIIDVAQAVGFDDQTHFARAFRRISGISPTAYRSAWADGCLPAR